VEVNRFLAARLAIAKPNVLLGIPKNEFDLKPRFVEAEYLECFQV
jgi:hypothetical protein